jgi:transposase
MIAKQVNACPNTVRHYRIELSKIAHDWSWFDALDDLELELVFSHKKQPDSHKRMPDYFYYHKLMQQFKHNTLYTLWYEYRAVEPHTSYCYSQFTHYYREYVSKLDLVMRQTHIAGECLYIDFAGKTIPWTDILTAQVHHAQVYVALLGCSQYTYGQAVASQNMADFCEATTNAIEFIGGVPKALVPDNLKSAVIKAGRFPTINRSFEELAEHYDTLVMPARVRKPKDKSLAEIGVLLVTRWITAVLRRRKFFSIEDINKEIQKLLIILNQRRFRRLLCSREERFVELDKPALMALPYKRYEFGTWYPAKKVGHDFHIEVNKHHYSVPHNYVQDLVEARVGYKSVELFCAHKRIAIHLKSTEVGGYSTISEHLPTKFRQYADLTFTTFITWAKQSVRAHAKLLSCSMMTTLSFLLKDVMCVGNCNR